MMENRRLITSFNKTAITKTCMSSQFENRKLIAYYEQI